MAKCEHLDPENLYHFLSITNLNVGGWAQYLGHKGVFKLQEEEFAQGAGPGVQVSVPGS